MRNWDDVMVTDGHAHDPASFEEFVVEEGYVSFEATVDSTMSSVIFDFKDAAHLDKAISTLQDARNQAFGERYSKSRMAVEVTPDFVPNISALEDLVASLKAMHKAL